MLDSPNKKVLPPNSTLTQAQGDAQIAATQAPPLTQEQQDAVGAPTGTTRNKQHVDNGLFGGSHEVYDYSANAVTDPNFDANRAKVNALADAVGNRKIMSASTATAAGGDTSLDAQTRNRQNALLDHLTAQANGTAGPSAAEGLLKTGADRAQAAALARAAASGTEGGAREASFEGASAIQDAAAAGTTLRAQEQQNAQGLLANAASGVRTQDQGIAQLGQQNNQFNAGQSNAVGVSNLNSGVVQQNANTAAQLGLIGTGLNLDQQRTAQDIQQNQFNAGLGASQEAAKLGVAGSAAQANAQGTGAIASGVGTTLAAALPLLASDSRLKTEIKNGDKEVENFLDHIGAKGFVYKDPAMGAGHRDGVMAQDVEKSPAGAAIVVETPQGKGIDKDKAISMSLAALANINKRLRQLGA